jgi:hypothetical protein
MCGEALRPPARRRSADEQKFWSDIRVDGSGDDTNGRPGRLQSYSYSHSSVRRADGSVSGQTMGEYVDHAGRKEHSRERRVGDTRMLETTGERPGADRPMQSRELHNGDRAEAFDGVWEQPADRDSALRRPRRPRCRRCDVSWRSQRQRCPEAAATREMQLYTRPERPLDSSIRLVTRWHAACALVFTVFG